MKLLSIMTVEIVPVLKLYTYLCAFYVHEHEDDEQEDENDNDLKMTLKISREGEICNRRHDAEKR